MGEIVEKVVITADSSQAEAAFKRTGDAAKQAFDKAAKSADGLGKELSEDDKILLSFNKSLKAHADALRTVEQGNEKLLASQEKIRAEQEKISQQWAVFGKAVAAATVALAIYEMKRAFEALTNALADSITPLSQINGEWSRLDKTLGSIKDTIEDPEFQKLNIFEKALATAYFAADTDVAEAKANADKIARMAKERELNNRALMRMVEEEGGWSGKTEDLTAKFKGGEKKQARTGKPAGQVEKYTSAWQAPSYDIPFDQGAAMEAQQRYAEAAAEIEQTKADRIAEINANMFSELQAAREEDARLTAQSYQETVGMVQAGVGIATGALMGLFEDLITGADDAGLKFARSMLMGIGQTLFQKGTADMAAAVASGLIYGNWSGIGAASAEMGIGASLMAGGTAVSATISNNAEAKSASERGGKKAESFSAGGAGGIRRSSGGESTNITINLQGPVYDGAAAGVAIMQKIAEAKKQGMLR